MQTASRIDAFLLVVADENVKNSTIGQNMAAEC